MGPVSMMSKGLIGRWLARRRFPTLLLLVGGLLLADTLVPDPIPFLDEIVLMILTAVLAGWKTRRARPTDVPPPIDTTARVRPV